MSKEIQEKLDDLEKEIRKIRPSYDEKTYQNRIEESLRECDKFAQIEREAKCGKGRVDFVIDGIMLEVKTSGNAISAFRQITEYVKAKPDVQAVMIVHTRGQDYDLNKIGNRPVRFVNVAFSAI